MVISRVNGRCFRANGTSQACRWGHAGWGCICRLAVAAKVFWKWHGRPARGTGEFLRHGQDAHATLEDRQTGDAPAGRGRSLGPATNVAEAPLGRGDDRVHDVPRLVKFRSTSALLTSPVHASSLIPVFSDPPVSLPPSEPLTFTDQLRWFAEEVLPHEQPLRSYLRQSLPSLADTADGTQPTGSGC